MEIILAITIGVLYATAGYLLLRRSIMKVILGVVILSQAVNLLILTSADVREGSPPFVPANTQTLATSSADPLPQALVLTAIVISFGVLAFFLAMAHRAERNVGSDDLNDYRKSDGN